MSAVQLPENANAPNRPADPPDSVLGVTLYDRVTALLLTLIVTLGGFTVGFGALWVANQPWWVEPPISRVNFQSILVDDDDDFGGRLTGAINDTDPLAPGVIDDDNRAAMTTEEPDRPSSEVPELNQLITNLQDQFRDAPIELEQVAFPADLSRSILPRGSDTTGKHGPLGNDVGRRGGLSRAKRWEIIFEPGLTEAEYARQLDFFRVELATVSDGKLYRVSGLGSPHPAARVGQSDQKELFFQWRDAARRTVDLGLLRKATELTLVENAIVLHFYPRETELKLLQLEMDFAARAGRPDLHQVAKTIFVVKKTETGYDFEVAKQTYLVQQM